MAKGKRSKTLKIIISSINININLKINLYYYCIWHHIDLAHGQNISLVI